LNQVRKIAMVTGAGTGIGRAASLALAAADFTIVLVGRRPQPLETVAVEITARGGEAVALPCNVAEPDSVEKLFAAVQKQFGRLDVLFNNAGAGAPKVPLEDLEFKHWKRVFDVNATGVFLCTQQAFRLMKAQTPRGGRIINNGSVSAHSPRPFGVAYTASKHAVTGLTKATALDGRAYDIACGQIDIGNAGTENSESLLRGVTQADGRIAPEPIMDLGAVAGAIVLMANLPLDANVQFMTLIATKMPFIGRG
jgi:NAD(P)-dependent dehydrogenase (short-subunit alcohol dehydrogenase family)